MMFPNGMSQPIHQLMDQYDQVLSVTIEQYNEIKSNVLNLNKNAIKK